jgi:hypothetical protein
MFSFIGRCESGGAILKTPNIGTEACLNFETKFQGCRALICDELCPLLGSEVLIRHSGDIVSRDQQGELAGPKMFLDAVQVGQHRQ